MNNNENFYVVRRESGTQRSDLPVWAPKSANPFALDKNVNAVSRVEVDNVPGAFQLRDALLPEEVQRILDEANQAWIYRRCCRVSTKRSSPQSESQLDRRY